MEIAYLGPLEVRADDGSALDVPGARLRMLLGLLAAGAGNPVSSGALADALWGQAAPADPVNALQSLVSRLRRALGEPGVVEQAPGGYRLRIDPESIDAVRFERFAVQGRAELAAGSPSAAAGTLADALRLWRGEPLPDDDGSDAATVRARLELLHLQVCTDRFEAELALGRASEVVADVGLLAGRHPLREDIAALRMRALVAAGRPAEALAAYEENRRFLAETLGSDPSPVLQDQHLAVLRLQGASSVARTNVRASVTSFVGREKDARRIDALLAGTSPGGITCRLVTIVGAGGAGKTRLASEVAAGWVARARDGVWLAELAPVTDPDNIALAVLEALGNRSVASFEQRGDLVRLEARQQIIETLGGADALIVIDNCEHVIDAAAALIAELLGACPRVRVIATSREPLAIDGETLYPLTPLRVPGGDASLDEIAAAPAVRLLIDRARSAGAALSVDADNAASFAEVVRRLDGLPLAIELAAARLRVMTLAEVTVRLADRFRLLTGGRRTAMPRHRTLRAVVEWSWDLLTPAEREVAEHFSVFGSGATAAAVAAVCPPAQPALDVTALDDVLHALVDKSLLVSEPGAGEPRYRMLETLREFGSERLAERGVGEAAQARHAHYFAALVGAADAGLRTSAQISWLRRLDAERDDALTALAFLGEHGESVAALEMAVGLAWFWMLRENGKDAGRWLRFAIELPGVRSSDLYAVAVALHVVIAYAVPGNASEQEWQHQQLVSIADSLGGSVRHQLAAVLRPLLLFFAEEGAAARAEVNINLDGEDPWVRAASRTIRVAFAENDGDLESMRSDVETNLIEWQQLGDHWGAAAIFTARGQLRTLDGDTAGAAEDFQAALHHLRNLGGSGDDLMVNMRLADLRLRAGDPEGARRFADAVRSDSRYGDLGGGRDVLADIMLAGIAAELGDEVELLAVRERLLAGVEGLGEPSLFHAHAAAVAHAHLASIAVARGELSAARGQVADAVRLATKTNDLPILATCGVAVATYAQARGAHRESAVLLGASAGLRGSPDHTDRSIARLTATLRAALGEEFDAAYDEGRRLDRDVALARLDPALLD